jgi:hypothetical protein
MMLKLNVASDIRGSGKRSYIMTGNSGNQRSNLMRNDWIEGN